MQGNGIVGIEKVELGIEKADFVPLAFHFEVDDLAAQESVDLPDVGLHRLDLDGTEPHGAACREASADPEIDAPGREPIERGECVGGHWGDAVRWHQYAGAEADPPRVDRRSRHGDKAIGAQHLGVVEPGICEAEFLGPADDVVGVRRRWQRDAEIHHVTSLCRSVNIWIGYTTFITFFGQSMQDCPYLEKTSTAGLGFGHSVAIICLSDLWIRPIAKND